MPFSFIRRSTSTINQFAKKVFEKVFDEDVDPVAYVEEHGLKIVEDTGFALPFISFMI